MEEIQVKLNEDEFEMLVRDRLDCWGCSSGEKSKELYYNYLKELAEAGALDGLDATISDIVDDTVLNSPLEVVELGESDFEKILENYKEEGLSFEMDDGREIVGVDCEDEPTAFLLRY